MVFRPTLRFLAPVAVLLVAAELAFRAIVPSLSANSRTLAQAPQRAAALRAHRPGPTMLILGNSISGDGIDPRALETRLQGARAELRIEHLPADTTVMRDWYYELKNVFIGAGAIPDWLVLPVGDAHPLMRVNERTEDLLYSFVEWGDVPDLIRVTERSPSAGGGAGATPAARFEDRAGLVLAKASALYGFRGRLQKRVLVTLVPGYEAMRLAMRSAPTARQTGEDAVSATDLWARRVASLCLEHGIHVVIVAMPTLPLPSGLPTADRALAAELGWQVVEPGAGHEWIPADRPDGLHLVPAARARFTELLASSLAPVVADRSAAEPMRER